MVLKREEGWEDGGGKLKTDSMNLKCDFAFLQGFGVGF
jgi:hypothetical protein